MNITFYSALERGHARHGWLESHHSFSFAGFHHPELMNFGALRVLNDDTVLPGYGFGTHPHDNMEIISIPLEGALAHEDSTGRKAIIRSGDIQMMSAGSGISHSEKNASQTAPVKFLQIWIIPNQQNGEPVYQQISPDLSATGLWHTVVSPAAPDDSRLQIRQQSWLSLATAGGESSLDYSLRGHGTGLFLMVLEGTARVEDQPLGYRDAAGISGTPNIRIQAAPDSRLLAIEVPL